MSLSISLTKLPTRMSACKLLCNRCLQVAVLLNNDSFAGPEERSVRPVQANATTTKTHETISPQKKEEITFELSKDIYSEMFEDADDIMSQNGSCNQSEEIKQATLDPQNSICSDSLETAEDWDKEMQDSTAYKIVLDTFKQRSHNKVYFQNKLQNLLYSYPPASQAFSKTANYKSPVYQCSPPPPGDVQDLCTSALQVGQFDDADEDSSRP